MNLVKLLIDGPKEIPKSNVTVETLHEIEEPEPVEETPEMLKSRKNIERMLKVKQKK